VKLSNISKINKKITHILELSQCRID